MGSLLKEGIDGLAGGLALRFPALGYRNFRLFLAGQSVSLVGTWMQRAAQQWLVYELTHSPLILGLVGVFQFTPMLLFSLFAGVFVDRFPKKTTLLLTQSIQMLQAFSLAFLTWSGSIRSWHILVMAALLGLAHTMDMPTRQSFFIELVGREALVSAIGLNSTVVNLGRIAGPAIGGVLLASFGAAACFFVNGVSFFAVLTSLAAIRSFGFRIRKKEGSILREAMDGLRYVFSERILFHAVASMFIVGTIAMNSDVIIPVLSKEVLHQQAGGYSLLLSAMGVGSLTGSLLFAGKRRELLGHNTIFRSALLLGLLLVLAGLSRSYYISMAGLAAVGLFSMIFMATVNSTIQLNSTDEYRGRAMGVYTLVFTGTTPLGNFLTGWVMQEYGANASLMACGALTVLLIGGFYFQAKNSANN